MALLALSILLDIRQTQVRVVKRMFQVSDRVFATTTRMAVSGNRISPARKRDPGDSRLRSQVDKGCHATDWEGVSDDILSVLRLYGRHAQFSGRMQKQSRKRWKLGSSLGGAGSHAYHLMQVVHRAVILRHEGGGRGARGEGGMKSHQGRAFIGLCSYEYILTPFSQRGNEWNGDWIH